MEIGKLEVAEKESSALKLLAPAAAVAKNIGDLSQTVEKTAEADDGKVTQ